MSDETAEALIGRLRDTHALGKLLGQAPVFVKAIAQLGSIARSDASVLISGQTGTGKELVARALHYLGPRAAFPFVAVNCGALLDTLLEDELFGHEPGAFTDARRRRPGLLTEAVRGTLFLDEIESLSDRGQVTLLRVLQDRSYRALGSSQERRADVRFVAATNAPLAPRVRAGTFRADLYYRLCVFSIDLPPLRARREDVLLLAAHFLDKHAPPDQPAVALSSPARAALLAFDWPGNVRELENAMVRALGTGRGGTIEVADLCLPGTVEDGPGSAPAGPTACTFQALKRLAVDAFEREYLTRLMTQYGGNVSRAARAAGKDRRELGRLLKKHRLDAKRFVAAGDRLPTAG